MAQLPKVGAALVVLVSLAGMAQEGQAQTFFSGYTNGAFCSACANPNTSGFQTATLSVVGTGGKTQTLRYVNSVFSGTAPSGGSLLLNSAATASTVQNVNNFGAFYVGGGNVTYSSPFSLWITFVDPTTTTLLFAGQVSGTITAGAGTITIDFDPNTQGFTFAGGNGWASVTVNDGSVLGENNSSLTGVITAQVAPEPVTLSLIGTGLLGLAGAARRRRRKQNDQ